MRPSARGLALVCTFLGALALGESAGAAGVGLLHTVWPETPRRARPADFEAAPVPKLDRVSDNEADHERSLLHSGRTGGVTSSRTAEVPGVLESHGGKTPGPAFPPFKPFAHGIVDAMIAVGEEFVVVTTQTGIGFFDRSGNRLPETQGVPTKMNATEFFGRFIAPTNTDGSVNTNNINRHLGFPAHPVIPCDPAVAPDWGNFDHQSCVSQFYDVRATYSPAHKRFFILAAARNRMWIKNEPDDDPALAFDDEDHVKLVRRYFAFAVSRSEDPRDGFDQWITTDPNYADWPRMSVNSRHLLITHNSPENGKPRAYVFHAPDLVARKDSPANWTYLRSDFPSEPEKVYPVTQHGRDGGRTFLVAPGNPVRVYAFTAGHPGQKMPLLAGEVTLDRFSARPDGEDPGFSFAATNPVYRGGKIHHASEIYLEATPDGEARRHIRYVRLPVEVSNGRLTVSKSSAQGYLDKVFGRNAQDDPAASRFSYHRPSVEVNSRGDAVVVFYRYRINGESTAGDEARYSVLYNGNTRFRSSALLGAGECLLGPSDSGGSRMHHGGAAVDPANPRSVWVTHGYCWQGAKPENNTLHMVAGKVTP